LWGTDTVFRRPLTAHLDSITIVLLEHLILSLVLLPMLWSRRSEWTQLGAGKWVAVIGIAWGGSALATVLFTEAVRTGNPSTAVLLQKSQPMFAGLLAGIFLSEPLGIRFFSRLAVATAGAYLISFGVQMPHIAGASAASFLALGAAGLWGASTVLGRYVLGSLTPLTLTALRITIALPMLAALALYRGPVLASGIAGRQVLFLLLVAFVPGLAGLMVYYRGLRGSYASRAAVAELCFPATAVLLNWVFFDTRISAAQGAGFLLLAATMVSWSSAKSGPERETDCATHFEALSDHPLLLENKEYH